MGFKGVSSGLVARLFAGVAAIIPPPRPPRQSAARTKKAALRAAFSCSWRTAQA
jgi:hypothetical protein